MKPIKGRLTDTRNEWLQRGNEIWSDLQGRREEWLNELQSRRGKLIERGQSAIEAGQKALEGFEATVLSRTADFLSWAYSATGERSEALRKSLSYLQERLGSENGEDFESFDVRAETSERDESAEADESAGAPFEGYDDMTAKDIIARLDSLSAPALNALVAYEGDHKSRKTILSAAEKLLS